MIGPDYLKPLIVQALKHTRYWMRKLGMTPAERRAVWRMMMEGER